MHVKLYRHLRNGRKQPSTLHAYKRSVPNKFSPPQKLFVIMINIYTEIDLNMDNLVRTVM